MIKTDPCGDVSCGQRYVDRGNKAPPPDFDQNDLTQDNAWHDLDLSAIVPAAGANHLVYIQLYVIALDPASLLTFRQTGNAGEFVNENASKTSVPVALKRGYKTIQVVLDATRKIEYKSLAEPYDFTTIQMTVRGWWIG